MELFEPCDALHNMRIGGPYKSSLAFAFNLPYPVVVDAVRFYCLGDPSKVSSGYAGGDGGTGRIILYRQQKTGSRLLGTAPTPPVEVARTGTFSPKVCGSFPSIAFEWTVELGPNFDYFLVFENVARDQVTNYFSVNFMHTLTLNSPQDFPPCAVQWKPTNPANPWTYFKPENLCRPIFSLSRLGQPNNDMGNSAIETSILAEQQPLSWVQTLKQRIIFKEDVFCSQLGLRLTGVTSIYPTFNVLLSIRAGMGMPLRYAVTSGVTGFGSFYNGHRVGHEYLIFSLISDSGKDNRFRFEKDFEYELEFTTNDETILQTFAIRDGQVYGFGSPVVEALATYKQDGGEEIPFMKGKWGTNPVSLLPLKFF